MRAEMKAYARFVGLFLAVVLAVGLLASTGVAGPVGDGNQTIDGDSVYIDNIYGKITVTPHTSSPNPMGCHEQIVDIIWKYPDTELDFAFQLDLENDAKWTSRNAYIWKSYLHEGYTPVYGNVNETKRCNSADYGFIDEDTGWCNETGDVEGNVYYNYWEHDFDWYEVDATGVTIIWNTSGITHYEDATFEDWYDISDRFTKDTYLDDIYYWIKNTAFKQNEPKLIKIEYCAPETSGKWGLFAKRSSDTIAEAKESGYYIHLDPWWDAFKEYFYMAAHAPDDDENLILYMPFESDYLDEGRYKFNNGTPHGDTKLNVSGAMGQCVYLAGTDDYINVSETNLNLSYGRDPHTIELWAKPETLPANGDIDYIVSKQHGTTYDTAIWLYNDGGTQQIGANGGYWAYTLPTDGWTHIAANISGQHVILYINGVSQGSASVANNAMTNQQFTIGVTHDLDQDYYGHVDEIMLYNRSLSATEILNHYQAARNNHTVEFGHAPSVSLNATVGEGDISYAIKWYMNGTTNRTTGADAVTDPNLIAWYPLDGSTSDYAHQHDGTAVADAVVNNTYAKVGAGSYDFDGTGDYINLGDSPDWVFGTGDFAIELWARFRATGAYAMLVAQWENNGGADKAWTLTRASTNKIVAWASDGGATNFITLNNGTKVIAANTWYHVVMTREGDNAFIYVNGVMDASDISATGTVSDSTVDALIGAQWAQGAGSPQHYIKGQIDEVRIYNRSITEVEALEHYKAGLHGGLTVPRIDTTNNANWTIEITPVDLDTVGTTVNASICLGCALPIIDTCTPPASGDWHVVCNDNCTITSDVGMSANTLWIYGTSGSFTVSGVEIYVKRLRADWGCKLDFPSGGSIRA